MPKLTDRQIEFLAQRLLKRSPNHRLSGLYQGKAGAAISAMISRLEALDMIDSKRRQRITREGLDEVEKGLGRILPEVDDIAGTLEKGINDAIAVRRAELDAEERLEAAMRTDLAKASTERIAKRNAAIPEKLEELVTSHGFLVLEGFSIDCADEHLEKTEDERLVALWNAIVDADASL